MQLRLAIATPVFTVLGALAGASSAQALIVAPPPPAEQRVAAAERIVVGRIIGLEEQTVTSPPYRKAPDKVTYRVARLKVSQNLKGAEGDKELRVGFVAPPEKSAEDSVSIKPTGPRYGPTLTAGQEGLFYLKKHHQESFLIIPMYYDFVSGELPNFKQEVELVRQALKLGTNPAAGLESRDTQVRYFAAVLLIQRYRTFRGGSDKTEPIDARESRLILTALAEADWKQEGQISPWSLFAQLGLSREDGWTFPAGTRAAQQIHAAAQAWLREHAQSYRIRRIVGEDAK